MGYYRDLREHMEALEAAGKLVRIRRQINKDSELVPLVKWQFRGGLPEEQRKAFFFDNIVDVKGKRYNVPAIMACYAASRQVYAMGMKCQPDEIPQKWQQAQLHPIQPKMVSNGAVHEEVHIGDRLLEHGGLEEFPTPISTPGFDNAPYLTAGCWVTKDPNTGVRNVGVYRGMVKSRDRLGINVLPNKHAKMHWDMCREKGIPLQAAIVLGGPPSIVYVSVTPIPYGVDEYTVAGGIAGEPVELVKCRTVDLEVPARAEIVIEGFMPTDSLEREAPFGEYTGYMGQEFISPYLNVTCITHRRSPIYPILNCQYHPTESSVMRRIGFEATYFKHLKYAVGLPDVLDVAFHDSGGSTQYCVIRMKKSHASSPWRALYGVANYSATLLKVAIVVDEDIDPWDADSVNWALSFRMQPHRDIQVTRGKSKGLDYSATPPGTEESYPEGRGLSTLLIDATRKWAYPPVSLPKKEFMERARKIWEEEGLPPLTPRQPWYGYSLGYWTEENEAEAKLALEGEHYKTGEKLARQREKPPPGLA